MSTRIPFTDCCSMTTDPTTKYVQAGGGGGVSYVSGKGRFGGKALQLSGGGATAAIPFSNNPATVIFPFAFQFSISSAGTVKLVEFIDLNLNTVQCSLGWLPSGQLQAYRGAAGSTAIGSPSTQTFAANVIYQLECKITINGTTGLFEVRLNGNTTPIISFTGNTQSSANAYCSGIRMATTVTTWYSDIIAFDSGGSAPNDYIGNKRVYLLQPNADSATGGLNQFSTSPSQSAGFHYLNINGATPPGDSSYNFDSTTNDRESYRIPSLPANASGVVGINIWSNVRIDDAGPHTFEISSRSGVTDAFSAAFNPGATYSYFNYFQAVDPATSAAWTPGAVGGSSGSEIGVKIIS